MPFSQCICASMCVCVSFIDQQMCVCVCVMRSRRPDGLMGNKKPFIYLYDLIKWHLFLSLGVCVHAWWCACVCVCVPCLMTNRIEGSEQSGLNDYYGSQGERLMEWEKEKETGQSPITKWTRAPRSPPFFLFHLHFFGPCFFPRVWWTPCLILISAAQNHLSHHHFFNHSWCFIFDPGRFSSLFFMLIDDQACLFFF